MERLPFAFRAMADAAVEAGIIDGSKTAQEREAALNKLMEQGKLISADVLPFFGKQLQVLANDNKELSKALRENLSPALGRAKNNLVLLQDEVYKGMKPALMTALDGFSDLSKESGILAYSLGKVLGGAMLAVSTVIRLPIAALLDLGYAIKDITGLSDENAKMIVDWGGTIVGATAGVWGLVKAIKALKGAYNLLKGSKVAAQTLGTATKTPTAGIGKALGKGVLKSGGSLLGKMAGPLAVGTAGYELYDRAVTHDDRMNSILDWIKGRQEDGVRVEVNLNPNGLENVIDARVYDAQGREIEDAYRNLTAGGER